MVHGYDLRIGNGSGGAEYQSSVEYDFQVAVARGAH
jgi:hypothetical protein